MGILGLLGLGRPRRARRAVNGRRRAVAPRLEGMEQRALLATTAAISQTLTLAATPTNFGYATGTPAQALTPALSLFNPALGTLVDVKVTGTANLTSQIKAQNLSTSSGTTITAQVKGTGNPSATDATFEVDGLNFTLTGAGSPTNTATVSAFPSGGTIDFQPPSGVTFPPLLVQSSINQTFTDAASLSFYTATSGKTSISPTMSAQAFASASAPTGNLATSVLTTAGSTITVTYDYIPGPPSVARFGVHRQPTSLVLSLTTAVAPADAQNVNNYAILTSGRDRKFGTRDDVVIPLNAAIYNTTTNAVTLIPAINLDIHQPYRLVFQFPGQSSPTVIPFNHSNLAGFNYHGGRFFQVVDGHVVR